MLTKKQAQLIVASSVLLFLIQALRVIFSVLFGIIYDQIFEGPMDTWLPVSNLLVMVALAAPVLTKRASGTRAAAVLAVVTALARISLTINNAEVRYWGSLITLAFGLMYLAVQLRFDKSLVVQGLITALVVEQLLRAAGATYDISIRSQWLPMQLVWGAALALLAWRQFRVDEETSVMGGIGWSDGLAIGGFLFLEISLLSLPNAIARWSAVSYAVTTPLLVGLTLIFVFAGLRNLISRALSTWMARLGLIVLTLLCLLLGYFTEGVLALSMLLLAQFATLTAFSASLEQSVSTSHVPGVRLAVGMLVFLILNFLNAFAFTYPYTLPLMRAKGWIIYLVASVLATSGSLLLERRSSSPPSSAHHLLVKVFLAIGVLGLTVFFSLPRPASPIAQVGRVRIATYNIHYGYNDAWRFTLEEMAQAIEEAAVDVVALQEVDTGRITSYSVDDALYLSRRLRMNVVYLPTVEHLTGIAILYRGPIAATESQWLSSLQEQTGIVHVRLDLQGAPLNAFGIWMGLNDENTQRQIEEALTFIADSPYASFGGDFNAEEDEPVPQAILAAGFRDPFRELGIVPAPSTSPAIDPRSRIDYVWLRGLRPTLAWVSESLASDHRMVIVEVEAPQP